MTRADRYPLSFERRDSNPFRANAASLFSRSRLVRFAFLAAAWLLIRSTLADGAPRPFHFPADTFAYANDLLWEYQSDPETGQMIGHRREPKPNYALHCFVVARSARQFFEHARFDPTEVKATAPVYRHLVRLVLERSSRLGPPDSDPVVIPGYSNLFDFSTEHEALLKAECGGAWQSYLQRGNWRMIFPFSRCEQARMAVRVEMELRRGEPVLVHLVCFPSLTLNHVLLLYGVDRAEGEIRFRAYDPNRPGNACELGYDPGRRQFIFPRNNYFAGGPVNVYEIYRGLFY